jgi:hypothetical protein
LFNLFCYASCSKSSSESSLLIDSSLAGAIGVVFGFTLTFSFVNVAALGSIFGFLIPDLTLSSLSLL